MKFFSQYSFSVTKHTDLSRRIVSRHDFRMSKEGKVEIVETGRVDVDAAIQSFAGEVGTYNVIRRAISGNDMTLVNRDASGVYADISDAPKSIHEAMSLAKRATSAMLKKRLDAAKKPDINPDIKPVEPVEPVKPAKE